MQKLSFEELIVFEHEYDVWELTLFGYPLWIHCREPLLAGGMMAERKIMRPKSIDMMKSFMKTMKFLFTQKKYDKVFFLMERTELLEIYKRERSANKLLFLNHEQERVYEETDYIGSEFFNLLRFISRKVAYRIFRKKYKKSMGYLKNIEFNIKLDKYIQNALGDALFLQFISLILSRKNQKYYTGSVIPMGEKFLNRLNTYEVQHGVIHSRHVGYIGLPEVKNNLIIYSSRYKTLLEKHGYRGPLVLNEYKKTFFEKKTKRHFPIVIYTQPTLEMQEEVSRFMKHRVPKNVFIQRHPKDYYNYDIESCYFVTGTTPFEVGHPIMYISSVIENFTLYDRTCYIFDLDYPSIDLDNFLKIYTVDSRSDIIIMKSLDNIYQKISGELVCQK